MLLYNLCILKIWETVKSMERREKPYLSLRYKLLIPLMTLGIAMFIMGYFGAREYLRSTIYRIMNEEIDSITEFVKNCMDEDQLEVLTSGEAQYIASLGWPAGMTDSRYWEQQECLDKVYDYNPRAQLYTYYAVDETTLAYGLDQWATLDPEYSYILGDEISGDDDIENLWRGLVSVNYYDELEYDETDDVYYHAVTSPLINSSGMVIGGLSVYLDAGWAVESLQELSNYLLVIFAAIFVLVTFLVLAITRTVTSELVVLQATSRRVADGDYTPISLKSHAVNDEVSTLADLFNSMLGKVREREETLQTEVAELKVQIDIEKRNKDVQEIVDSEFFQDLKQRAAEMRKEKSKKE
jgi:methyl-accepting chemotaxis protein